MIKDYQWSIEIIVLECSTDLIQSDAIKDDMRLDLFKKLLDMAVDTIINGATTVQNRLIYSTHHYLKESELEVASDGAIDWFESSCLQEIANMAGELMKFDRIQEEGRRFQVFSMTQAKKLLCLKRSIDESEE